MMYESSESDCSSRGSGDAEQPPAEENNNRGAK